MHVEDLHIVYVHTAGTILGTGTLALQAISIPVLRMFPDSLITDLTLSRSLFLVLSLQQSVIGLRT